MFKFFQSQGIPHYHGDEVRRYFFAVVALGFIAIPIWGEVIPVGVLLEVAGGILLIVLAGFTSPHSKIVLVLDALVAIFGVFLLEMAAIGLFHTDSIALFLVREVSAILLAFGLYASIKTIRAMVQGKVGVLATQGEFEPHAK